MIFQSASEYLEFAKDRLTRPHVSAHPGETEPPEGEDRTAGPRRRAAVAVLFAIHCDLATLLLIRRSALRGNHRTEWAFPGGVAEPADESLLETAIRETEEELGLTQSDIDIWGELPKVITGTGFEVKPFAGFKKQSARLLPSANEVDDVAFVPVNRLGDVMARRQITLMRAGVTRTWDAIEYDGRIIWGATARIIHQVMSELNGEANPA